MSLIRNQFGDVNNPSRTIKHSLRKSACCKLLSVQQFKNSLNNKTINLLITMTIRKDTKMGSHNQAYNCYRN